MSKVEHLICNKTLIKSSYVKADADPSAKSCEAKSCEAKVPVTKSKGGGGKNLIHADSIKLVRAGSGCVDAKKVEQVMIPKDCFFLCMLAIYVRTRLNFEVPMMDLIAQHSVRI